MIRFWWSRVKVKVTDIYVTYWSFQRIQHIPVVNNNRVDTANERRSLKDVGI